MPRGLEVMVGDRRVRDSVQPIAEAEAMFDAATAGAPLRYVVPARPADQARRSASSAGSR